MKRLLMLVGVAVVAGAMYVAASPASQQSRGPTLRQFTALKKQVAALSKKLNTTNDDLNTTNDDLNTLAFAYLHCSLHSEISVTQRGSPLEGYLYGTSGTNAPTTALDIYNAAYGPTITWVLTPYNASDSACQSLVGTALGHNPGQVIAQKFAQKH